MTTVYKVLDPRNGTYTTHTTVDLCLEHVMKVAYEFYLQHTHNVPYSMVIARTDGSETWKTPQGVDIPNQEALRAKMLDKVKEIKAKILANQAE